MSNQATRLSNCPAERLAQCRGQSGNSVDQVQDEPSGMSRHLPENCRQRLVAEGKSYAKSNCAVCGQFSPRWRECDAVLAAAPVPPANVPAIAKVTYSGYEPANHLDWCAPFSLQGLPDGTELVDRAHATRLQAEVSALQRRLNIADQRVCDLTAERGGLKDKIDLLEAQAQNDSEANTAIRAERDHYQSELTKARNMVRWFYTHANVHQVGTVMMDAARDFIAHQSAPAAKVSSHVWVCADNRGAGAGEICQAFSVPRPAAKLDASMIGIVDTPPMEYDEP